jgi:NAD(P)H dehydrogenase (quinone)
MKVLIVYAHPSTGGHCAAILSETKRFLARKEMKFELVDLYKINYDPVLRGDELYRASKSNSSKLNNRMQELIASADQLIFIYPVWWGSMPAILKGFFDKTLTSKFAFTYVNGLPKGSLNGKKALVFLASGASSWASRLFQHNVPVNLIKKDILGFCGIKTKVVFIGNCIDYSHERQQLISKVVPQSLKEFFTN